MSEHYFYTTIPHQSCVPQFWTLGCCIHTHLLHCAVFTLEPTTLLLGAPMHPTTYTMNGFVVWSEKAVMHIDERKKSGMLILRFNHFRWCFCHYGKMDTKSAPKKKM